MTDTDTYADVIDLAGIERNWPDGRQVPTLIRDVAALMASWPNGSFGHLRFKSTRFDDYWIELGGDLNEQFGIFINLPEGTNIAVWFHDGAVKDAEPVIELGSEGELHVLAPNLKSFFAFWTDDLLPKSSVAYNELTRKDAFTDPDANAQRSIHSAQLRALVAHAPDHPPGVPAQNISKFMELWGAASRAKIAADPLMQAILKLLDARIPRRASGSDPDTSYVFPVSYHVRIAGDRVEIQTPALPPDYTTFAPLPERDALIPLILQVREARARAHPGRGLWHSAMLQLHEDRTLILKASWEFEPEFREGGRMTKAEFEADLARFPKSPRWREPWMDQFENPLRFNIVSDAGQLLCPCCGLAGQCGHPPYDARGGNIGSGICACCMWEPGFDDDPAASANAALTIEASLVAYRSLWIEQGYPWRAEKTPPEGWEGRSQCEQLLRQFPHLGA
jgi:hypothetical protein